MKILFISQYIPYRADSGVTVKMRNLLACMTRVCNVSCLYIVDERERNRHDLDACGLPVINHLVEVKRDSMGVKRYISHLIQIFAIPSKVKDAVSKIIVEEKPHVVWLEFGYLGNLIPFLKGFGVPVIYSSHNSQFQLDLGIWLSTKNILYKLKMAPFVLSYYFHERLYFGQADLLLSISGGDREYYRKLFPGTKSGILPFFFDAGNLATTEAQPNDCPYLCMVGSLKAYQNYAAALFAIEKVWPVISREDSRLRLYIIGELPDKYSPEYQQLKRLAAKNEGVVLKGRVESVIPFVRGALVSLVPLTIGSGVRTKIIESVVCGTPVVSTSIGAEGLPFVDGESIFIADSADDLAEKVLLLVNDDTLRSGISAKAFAKYRKELSCDVGMKLIKNYLRDLNLEPNDSW